MLMCYVLSTAYRYANDLPVVNYLDCLNPAFQICGKSSTFFRPVEAVGAGAATGSLLVPVPVYTACKCVVVILLNQRVTSSYSLSRLLSVKCLFKVAAPAKP